MDYLDEVIEERRRTDPAYAMAKRRRDIVAKLVELLESLGLTQQQVADRMGVQGRNVGEIESMSHPISFESLATYADALGARIELVVPVGHS